MRAAANAAGLWTLGTWTPADQALQQGLACAADAALGTLVVTGAQGARAHLVTADGWNLSGLDQMLGAPLQEPSGKALALDSLPAGSCAVSSGSGGARLSWPWQPVLCAQCQRTACTPQVMRWDTVGVRVPEHPR